MTLFDQINEPLPQRVMVGLNKLSLALRSQAWRQRERQGLTPTQAQMLALLQARGALRLSALAAGLGIKASTASVAVETLVGKGLLDKQPVPDDGRAVAIALSPAGRRQAEQSGLWPDFLLRAVETLDPLEQAVLLKALIKMIRSLQLRGEIPIARMCVTCRYFRPRVHADPETPHHCALVDAPFGDRHLRLDCNEHETAAPELAAIHWQRFVAPPTPDDEAGGAP